MNAKDKLDFLVIKKQKLEHQLAEAKQKFSTAERASDTHIKAAIGGAVLALFEAGTLSTTIRNTILKSADLGVQKQGLGREKFDALKLKFLKPVENLQP